MTPKANRVLQWLRRLICIIGGGAAAYVLVFVIGMVAESPLDEAVIREVLFLWSPAASVIGGAVGAFIVMRAENLERVESKGN